MSGFQISFIILAAWPLCKAALEQEIDEARPYWSSSRHYNELSDSVEKLSCWMIDFAKALQELYQDAQILDSEQLQSVNVTDNITTWPNSNLEQGLEHYLDRNPDCRLHDVYELQIMIIRQNLAVIAGMLGLNDLGLQLVRRPSVRDLYEKCY